MTAAGGVVLCAGEPLITLAPSDGQPLEHAGALAVSAGGAEFNVAVQLARLGVPARFAGLVGADPWGRRIAATLRAEGADASFVREDPLRATGCYLKEPTAAGSLVHYYRSGSAGSALTRLPGGVHEGVRHVHLSGVAAALSAAWAALVRAELEQAAWTGRTTSFDVNYRRSLWPPEAAAATLAGLARLATITIVGLDEARLLWGCASPADVRALLAGAGELIVTDGPRDTVAFAAAGRVSATPPPVKVIDVIGAGDSFAAGYLAARLRGAGPRLALRAGHAVAAAVIASPYDYGSRADIEALVGGPVPAGAVPGDSRPEGGAGRSEDTFRLGGGDGQ
jgi:2-dehydro-3-deoxygluconokinase